MIDKLKSALGIAKSPEALLEGERKNVREQIARFNDGLVSHAAMCERLVQQVRKLEQDEQQLRARATANLRAGNRQAAGEAALRLQTVMRELDENRKQAEEAERTYKELVRARDASIEAARGKLEALRRGIDDMRIQEAMAELNKTAAGLITSSGGTGDALAHLEELVNEGRSKARGLNRVARDTLAAGDLEAQEMEQRALADQALADFAAQEGIDIDAAVASAGEEPGAGVAERAMGPGTTESE